MSTLDFHDMSATMRHMITGLADRAISGPLYVAKDGQPLAVIIRAQAYAPRLQDFDVRQDGDIQCIHCPGQAIVVANPYNLGVAAEAANQHWNDTHRGKP